MYPTLTRGSSSSTGASKPRPARRTGIATTSRSTDVDSASASGVRTVPWRTGRSAVASYSSMVISLLASTRNSSGGVLLSRRPPRLSATSGCLLMCSGTIVLDEPLQRADRDAQHAVHVRRIRVKDLTRAKLVDAEVDGAGANLPDASYHEQRRRLHVVAENAGARPHRQLIAQLMPARHAVGNEVRVERVDRPDDAHVVRRVRRFRRVDQRVDDVERRDRGVFQRHVAVGRALAAHRSDADDEVAHLDLGLGGST